MSPKPISSAAEPGIPRRGAVFGKRCCSSVPRSQLGPSQSWHPAWESWSPGTQSWSSALLQREEWTALSWNCSFLKGSPGPRATNWVMHGLEASSFSSAPLLLSPCMFRSRRYLQPPCKGWASSMSPQRGWRRMLCGFMQRKGLCGPLNCKYLLPCASKLKFGLDFY